MSFDNLKLNTWIKQQLTAVGVAKPTGVQEQCIPQILQGKDCIGCAKTGSGKTLAFVLPILQKFCEDPYGVFALVLTPTRELAFQIADQFKIMGKPVAFRDCVIVGGLDPVEQGIELNEKPHAIIATPGRLADHLEHHPSLSLKKIKFLVLDESDRLLDGRFNAQLKTIFAKLPKKRQTLLFSATLTDTLGELKKMAMTDPFFYTQGETSTDLTVTELDQRFVLCPSDVKEGYLVQVINDFMQKTEKKSVMVFTKTCKACQVITIMLKGLGFDCACIHSMIVQKERLSSLARFKSKQVRILIATDVASRGLDIPQVELVINHNIPTLAKDYVHRVGRTARAGRDGMAVTFVTQTDLNLLYSVEEYIGVKLSEFKVDEKEVLKILKQVNVAKRESELKLEEEDFDARKETIKRKELIMKGKDPDREDAKKKRLMKQRIKDKKQKFQEKVKARKEGKALESAKV